MRALKEARGVLPSTITIDAHVYPEAMSQSMRCLAENEKRAISLRFYEAISIANVADRMGLTWEEADHLIDTAVRKMLRILMRYQSQSVNAKSCTQINGDREI